MLALPPPRFMPCVRCGASVETRLADEHACDEERRLDYVLFEGREEIARFDADLGGWLKSPAGRFEQFYARRARRYSGVSGSMNGYR
jgi:hypothetical protein